MLPSSSSGSHPSRRTERAPPWCERLSFDAGPSLHDSGGIEGSPPDSGSGALSWSAGLESGMVRESSRARCSWRVRLTLSPRTRNATPMAAKNPAPNIPGPQITARTALSRNRNAPPNQTKLQVRLTGDDAGDSKDSLRSSRSRASRSSFARIASILADISDSFT